MRTSPSPRTAGTGSGSCPAVLSCRGAVPSQGQRRGGGTGRLRLSRYLSGEVPGSDGELVACVLGFGIRRGMLARVLRGDAPQPGPDEPPPRRLYVSRYGGRAAPPDGPAVVRQGVRGCRESRGGLVDLLLGVRHVECRGVLVGELHLGCEHPEHGHDGVMLRADVVHEFLAHPVAASSGSIRPTPLSTS